MFKLYVTLYVLCTRSILIINCTRIGSLFGSRPHRKHQATHASLQHHHLHSRHLTSDCERPPDGARGRIVHRLRHYHLARNSILSHPISSIWEVKGNNWWAYVNPFRELLCYCITILNYLLGTKQWIQCVHKLRVVTWHDTPYYCLTYKMAI